MLFTRRFAKFGTLLKGKKRIPVMTPLSKFARVTPAFYFSSAKAAEKMEFKAETKKLLDIVAKSLYTDSEVFIRELLSNASDALEKQRFTSQSNQNLLVSIETSPTKNQLVIQDNGIGMSRDDLINNLGTIAKSGSKEFMQKMEKEGKAMENNIIGQFGVGFYSSFMVADHVEVISRVEGQPAHKWSSDGTGTFEIQQVDDSSFERGTKIILHLKEAHKNFLEKTEIQKIAQKYSNFINFPITMNDESLNITKALWSRDKKDISEQEYQNFYEYLSGKTDKYQYKMHFVSDVPLQLKAVLYIPQTNSSHFTMQPEEGEVSLYSKKVLIKKDCKQILLPSFLRFMRGVVDCQDIPLNISRENYQDSALMSKLKSFITRRILKTLREQAENDPVTYNKWYRQFEIFIKQGSIDQQYKKQVALLNRYQLNTQEGSISLKDYIALKKPTQDRIFYMFSPNRVASNDSPYVYPLTQAGVPVLIASNHVDQIIFRELDTFEGLKFANVETDTQDVQRTLKGLGDVKQESKGQKIQQQQLTPFSLWIKQQLQPFVDKVNVSKKSMKGPAMVISPISSSMRQMSIMQQMMMQRSKAGLPKMSLQNLTFEYDPSDPLIVKLNEFRKYSGEKASIVVRQIFDHCCLEAGLESDTKGMIKRVNSLMDKYMTVEKERAQGETEGKKSQ